ncbi:hypothetical protein LB565_24910 [Mesorhizobium sp. CA14]|uniref:hypothetical protein n=1 Tax=Mesorhizobium sp. CA14 TaxID=2876642 RepID=UPI001CCCECD6|nr:hypothetical protein [Mesorhizobium sp. CA14]MBZ9851233.1 hypothetical protein [Mesorhizobium sp. CA14]
MTAERLKIRDVGEGYEVLDYDGKRIAICATVVHAACYVRGFAARFQLDWSRAVADPSTPSDYCASFLGSEVGKIRAETGHRYAGHWSWLLHSVDQRWRNHEGRCGREAGKDLAIASVEHEFTKCVADTPLGPSTYAQAKGI